MFYDIFKREDVRKFFKDIVTGLIYKEKEIPNTISDEKVDISYYAILMGYEAIIKYIIIVEDMNQFGEYLKQVQLLIRKVSNHNEIKLGINKLIINYCQVKLQVPNMEEYENKEIILKYIYNKYIIDGYFFYSFPSIFLEDVLNQGLLVSNYNYEIDSLKEIDKIFKKYKVDNFFSKDLESDSLYITVTDSIFMGCYYAYHSPGFLKEICTDLLEKDNNYKIDAFFRKDYKQCVKNLNSYMKKLDMSNKDINKVNDFFAKEWDLFKIDKSIPVLCFIKRSYLGNNHLKEINSIIEDMKEESLITSVSKVLETRYSQEIVMSDISRSSLEILYLPTLEDLGFEIATEEEKDNALEVNSDNNFIDDYGNITILALVGILLITIGLIMPLIMIGR